ncbi:MAG TPA: glycosyltransferase [Candidatus Omnitrophota bacterium]|nr:glycosyltransferase [Candidatus Omnitrophota bacterium]
MDRHPLVSVIIPTRSRPEDIEDCLRCLYQQTYPDFEVIVVDASPDEKTKDIVQKKFPKVHYEYFPNGENQRPKAKNIGIKIAKGDILAFIDDDSLVQKGWLEACVNSYSSPETGGVGGFIIEKKEENIKPKEKDYVARVTFNGTRIGSFNFDKGETIAVEHLRGCNMSFRREAVDKISGFDINYIGSNVLEETDFCVRIRKAGYKILYNPQMRVIHTAGARYLVQRTVFDYKRQYYITRNATYFMLKNYNIFRAFAYIMTNNTSIPAFVRNPDWRKFNCIFVGIGGKIAGVWVWVKLGIFRTLK